ncbi:MAG: hypothetical protein HY332_03165 [Chloroflexi bacterium]|nr:hypothetical protein [Chloroflexota bacterium]
MSASRPAPQLPPARTVPGGQLRGHADLLVAAGRERTVLASGFLAGIGVFLAPLVFLALGLLAAYLGYITSDNTSALSALRRPLEASNFRSVFAPVVNEAPLLVCAGLLGAALAQFRRWLARRSDPALLAAGVRPFFPEFTLLYLMLVALAVGLAAVHGGWPQLHRLVTAGPVFLLFMVCTTWLAHTVWQYCFRNILDLLASAGERDAAALLGVKRNA